MLARKPVLTAQELEIMKVVWRSGASTVRDVYETLLEHRKIAYTTVMTMMNILEQKGYLKKSSKDRAYVYQATRPQKQVIRGMVREFVDRVFNGSAEPLRSEEHTSELQSHSDLVCRLLLEKKKKK